MEIDLETAVRTLVCVSLGSTGDLPVNTGLIVAVLARKFSAFPEAHITALVTRIVLEEAGSVAITLPRSDPAPLQKVA